jgi:signal transduction histidine kinase
LTLVKRIVETHGGQVGVESKLGEGATFFFTIPKTPPLGLHGAQADASEGS